MILTTWMIQQNEVMTPTLFDKTRARHNMRPAYSAVSEYGIGRIKMGLTIWYRSGFVFVHLIPLSLFLMTIAALWRGRPRHAAFVLMLFTWLPLADAILDNIFLGNIFLNAALPGGYTFLDDYVYHSNADLLYTTPNRGNVIVAYERTPTSQFGRRIVGFADGHVVSIREEELVPILRAQGHELAPDDAQLNNP